MKKLRVAVLYGGRSGEHEVSLQSAASVITHLDHNRFEIVPVAIDKQGRWHVNDISLLEGKKSLPVFKDTPNVLLPPNPAEAGNDNALIHLSGAGEARGIDVVFPVMHGPLCEDGTIQGFLSWPIFPMSDAASSHRLSRWIRKWQNASLVTKESRLFLMFR